MMKARCVVLTLAVVSAFTVGTSAFAMGDTPPQPVVVDELPGTQNGEGPDLRKVHPESDPLNSLHNPFDGLSTSFDNFEPGGGFGGGGGRSDDKIDNKMMEEDISLD